MIKLAERYGTWFILSWCCLMLFVSGCAWKMGPYCSIPDRLLYSFCHVNVWHLLANVWAGFVISKSAFRDTPTRWARAYLVGLTVPDCFGPAMGMSGLLYALMGMLSWQALDPRKFHAWVIGFMLLGFLFPAKIGNGLHFYCYAMGILVEAVCMWIEDEVRG